MEMLEMAEELSFKASEMAIEAKATSDYYMAQHAFALAVEAAGWVGEVSETARHIPDLDLAHAAKNVANKIREVILDHGKQWIKGAAFYALIKTEKRVQPYKMVALRVKTSGKVYSGQEAREMLGIGQATGIVRLIPGDHGKFDVFIQSTSINRKIAAGTEVMYWPQVGTQRK